MANQQAYVVYLNGMEIDKVFYSDSDCEEVRRSLINHDGYDAGITVEEEGGEGDIGEGEENLETHADLLVETWRNGNLTACMEGILGSNNSLLLAILVYDRLPGGNQDKRAFRRMLGERAK